MGIEAVVEGKLLIRNSMNAVRMEGFVWSVDLNFSIKNPIFDMFAFHTLSATLYIIYILHQEIYKILPLYLSQFIKLFIHQKSNTPTIFHTKIQATKTFQPISPRPPAFLIIGR